MQNMNIEQLNEIISTMDLDKIRAGVEQHGFRCASKNGKWEFDMKAVSSAESVEATELHEDTFDDRKYHGEIYTGVEEYPNNTFVVIVVKHIYKHIGVEAYEQLICFTDAPVNEEYERKQNESAKCALCKKEFTAGELVDMVEKGKKHRLCNDCFKKKLKAHIQKRQKQLRRK